MASITSFLVGIVAVGGMLAAIFFIVKKSGRVELQRDIYQEIIEAAQKAQKKAAQDEKSIAAMSDIDKRNELSK